MPQMTLQTLTDSNLEVSFLFGIYPSKLCRVCFPTLPVYFTLFWILQTNKKLHGGSGRVKAGTSGLEKSDPPPNPFIFMHSLGPYKLLKRKVEEQIRGYWSGSTL